LKSFTGEDFPVILFSLINERLSEGHELNDFHFMRYVRCLDTGVECMGYREVMLKVQVVPRKGRK